METRLDRATLETGKLHGTAKVELGFDTSLDVGDKGRGRFRDDFQVSGSGEHVRCQSRVIMTINTDTVCSQDVLDTARR